MAARLRPGGLQQRAGHGGRQLDLAPSEQITAMSADQYRPFMTEHEVVRGTEQAHRVQRAGRRISTAAENQRPGGAQQVRPGGRPGLIFMAMAAYDPRHPLAIWQRMAAQAEGRAPPEFLSTHPAHGTRIERVRDYLPEAMRYCAAK